MAAPHVALRGVRKVFAGVERTAAVDALGPLDLELARGEFFAVVGPSGCGKSTLLELIAGLASPTEGSDASSWNTTPTPSGTLAPIGRPSNSTLPSVGLARPAISSSSVD